ncbi:MAG: hypothetical protein ACT4PP_11200 [Sporichthyaceae bacterium]
MRRVATAGAAIGVLALSAAALGMLEPEATRAVAAQELNFTATDFTRSLVDAGPRGLSLGDRVLLSAVLSAPGVSNGISALECVVTAIRPAPRTAKAKGQGSMTASSACVGTIETDNGLIAAQTLSSGAYAGGSVELVITGGSGDYEGAVGTVALGTSRKTASQVTVTLR